MPGNTFIKFGADVSPGESMQEGHHGDKGWIEISDWSWDVEAETSFLKGGGSAVGKATPGNLSITHYWDTSSPVIMKKIVAGHSFPEVKIDQLKQAKTGTVDKLTLFFQIVMQDVYVTKVSTKGQEDGSVTQDVEMVFKAVKIAYKPQLNDGSLDATQTVDWNVATMEVGDTGATKLKADI